MIELGVENFYIELIQECPCENKEQLRQQEGHHIRDISTLNHLIAGRTNKEWKSENKEHVKANAKIKDARWYASLTEEQREARRKKDLDFYHRNKERINAKRKVRRDAQKQTD